MKSDYKISIIVPIFNANIFIYHCLKTIVEQTLKEIEIILIDDGSTDDSLKVCKIFAQQDKRIKIYTQSNHGVSYTRNKGISLAKGKYILFLDGDDFFELDMCERLYTKAENTKSDIVFCDFYAFDTSRQKDNEVPWSLNKSIVPKRNFSPNDCVSYLFQLYNPCVWNTLYKREFILEKNISFPNIKVAEDGYFNRMALLTANKISCVPLKLIHYRSNFIDFCSKYPSIYSDMFFSYMKTYNFIQKNNLTQYLPSLWNKFLEHFFGCLESVPYPDRLFFERRFLFEFIIPYKLYTFKENYWYSTDIYKKIKRLSQQQNLLLDIPIDKKKIIPIVFSINEKYASYCGVSIQSIIHHSNQCNIYDIYVLYTELSDDSIFNLEGFSNKNIRVTCVNVNGLLQKDIYLYESNYAKETYYRFLIPQIFSRYNKVLYLDPDLIVTSDIEKLYHTSIKNYMLAAVVDPCIGVESYLEKTLNLELTQYFNSGVLLFNVQEWNRCKVVDEMWQYINTCPKEKLLMSDQDVLNKFFKNKTLFLNKKWNLMIHGVYDTNKKKWNPFYAELTKEKDFPNNISILHYAGSKKPWNNENVLFSDIWWRYAKISPFFERILQDNKKEKND